MTDAERIYAITRPDRRLLLVFFLRSIVFPPAFPFVFFYYWRLYRTLRYRFTPDGVSMTRGRWWVKESYLSYARIQDVHISRGIFQRWIGLATIHIQTASGKSEPEVSIEGIVQYDALWQFIYHRTRIARGGPALETPDAGQAADESLLGLLVSIRDEVRTLRAVVEKDHP